MRRLLPVLVSASLLFACGGGDDESASPGKKAVNIAPPGAPWDTLGEWHLFSDPSAQLPNERVEPYEVISSLWADNAQKLRFMHVPEGQVIAYDNEEIWQLPVGSVLVKTFAFPIDARDASLGIRLIETRLLVHEPDAWVPHVYLWNEEQTAAERKPTGATVPVSWIDSTGATQQQDYGVPNTNQCHDCHGQGDTLHTLGGRTRQLDREHAYPTGTENQLEHLALLGWLSTTPPAAREKLVDPLGSAPLEERARSYLDANCGHCHSAGGAAVQSGALFGWTDTAPGSDPVGWGVCKVPTSAGGATCGLVHDIVPGAPDESVLVCRMASREPKVQMPPLATRIADDAGVALISEWITSLTLPACN
jgi:uncharacterized repeat protein (TIGR03806 family)